MKMEEDTAKYTVCILDEMDKLVTESASSSNTYTYLQPREVLLDYLMTLRDERNHSEFKKESVVTSFVSKFKVAVDQIGELRMNVNDFDLLKLIGIGKFGEVTVIREKKSSCVYAMKKMRKIDILRHRDCVSFENERDIMVAARLDDKVGDWLACLKYAFQDLRHLYFVMDYYPGGNITYLFDHYGGSIPEYVVKFYIIEMIKAIGVVHTLGYVHRDIKPDNMLLDSKGHLKLCDFGSSAKLPASGFIVNKMPVGTPEYIAPEILQHMESDSGPGYGVQCDWWSLGVVIFELVSGHTPFFSDDVSHTYNKILYFNGILKYPVGVDLSDNLKSIISGLLMPVEERLTYYELLCHKYFENVDWSRVNLLNAPFIPSISSEEDTRYFADVSNKNLHQYGLPVEDYKLQKNVNFIGFTYTCTDTENDDNVIEMYNVLNLPVENMLQYDEDSTKENVDYGKYVALYNKAKHLGREKLKYQFISVHLKKDINQYRRLISAMKQKEKLAESNTLEMIKGIVSKSEKERENIYIEKEECKNKFKDLVEMLEKEKNDLLKIIAQHEDALRNMKSSQPSTPKQIKIMPLPSPQKSPHISCNSPQKLFNRIRDLKEEKKELKDHAFAEKQQLEKELMVQKKRYENLMKDLTQSKTTLLNDKKQLEKSMERLKSRVLVLEPYEKRCAVLTSNLEKEKHSKERVQTELEECRRKKNELAYQLMKLKDNNKDTPNEKRYKPQDNGNHTPQPDRRYKPLGEYKEVQTETPLRRQMASQKEKYEALIKQLTEEKELLLKHQNQSEKMIDNLNAKITQLESRVKTTDAISGALKDAENEISSLRQELDPLMNAKSQLEQLIEKMKDEIDQLVRSLERRSSLEITLTYENAKLSEKLIQLQKVHEDTLARMKILETREEDDTVIDDLSVHLEKTKAEKAHLEVQLCYHKAQIRDLQIELKRLKEERDIKKDDVAVQTATLDTKIASADTTSPFSTGISPEKHFVSRKLTFDECIPDSSTEDVYETAMCIEKPEELKSLNEQLNEMEMRLAAVQIRGGLSNSNVTETKLELKELELKKLASEIDELKLKLSSKDQELNILQVKLDRLEGKDELIMRGMISNEVTLKKLDLKEEELKKLFDEIDELKLKLASKDTELKKQQEKLNPLEVKDKELMQMRGRLPNEEVRVKELESKEEELKKLSDEIDELKPKLVSKDKELKKMQDKLNRLEAKNELMQMRERLPNEKVVTNELDSREKELNKLASEIDELKVKLAFKDKELKRTEEKITSLQATIVSKEKLISDLNDTLKTKLKCLTDREQESILLNIHLEESNQRIRRLISDLETAKQCQTEQQLSINKLKDDVSTQCNIKEKHERYENEIANLMKKMEDENNSHLTEKDEYESIVKQLKTDLAAIRDECTQLRKQNNVGVSATLQAQVTRLEKQLEESREKVVLSRETIKTLEKELWTRDKELSNTKIDLRILQRELKEALENSKQLEKERSSSDEKIKEAEEKVYEAQSEIMNLKEQLEAEKKEYLLRISDLNDITSKLRTVQEEADASRTELRTVKKKLHKAERLLKESTQEKNCLSEKVTSLQQETETTELKLAEAEASLKSLKDMCVLLDDQVTKSEEKIAELKSEIEQSQHEKEELINSVRSLENDLGSMRENLQSAKKSANEEKSLRIFAETKVKKLEEEVNRLTEDSRSLLEEIENKEDELKNAWRKISEVEEYGQLMQRELELNKNKMEAMKNESLSLKAEQSNLLTQIRDIQIENANLHEDLTETTEELNAFQEFIGELQSKINQWKAYNQEQNLISSTTFRQYTKLLDFVQTKICESKKTKRTFADKLFGFKAKENIDPKDLHNLLQLERQATKKLSEQLYQAQADLAMLRGDKVMETISTPKSARNVLGSLEQENRKNAALTDLSNSTALPAFNNLHGRIKHNIPHKFEIKMCTKSKAKCVQCNQSLGVGKKVSKCKMCRIFTHASCSTSVPSTCGLPPDLLDTYMAKQISQNSVNGPSDVNRNREPNTQSFQSSSVECLSDASTKSDVEGWLQVLGVNKVWEQVFARITNNEFQLYNNSTSFSEEPKWKIDLKSNIIIEEIVQRTTAPYLHNVTENDVPVIFKIKIPEQEKPMYLMAASKEDKMNWINALRTAVTSNRKNVDPHPVDSYRGTCLVINDQNLDINCVVQLNADVCLIGASQGFYSYRISQGEEKISQCCCISLCGVPSVHFIKLLPKLRIALFIAGCKKSLMKCDLRQLIVNAEAAKCTSPCVTMEHATPLDDLISGCYMIASCSTNRLLSVAHQDYMTILEWNEDSFETIKYKTKLKDIICMMFTPCSLIYGTKSGFYCISLADFHIRKIYTEEEQFSKSLPVNILKISREEYMICSNLFGVLVSQDGKVVKTEPIKWLTSPHKIVYNKRFILSTHKTGVCLNYLSPREEDSAANIINTCTIEMNDPVILGLSKHICGGIFLGEEGNKRIILLDCMQYMRKNKHSWSSISTTSGKLSEDRITEELNISTDFSVSSSLLDSVECLPFENNQNTIQEERKVKFNMNLEQFEYSNVSYPASLESFSQ